MIPDCALSPGLASRHLPVPPTSDITGSRPAAELHGLRVLAVEDHEDSLELLTAILGVWGCTVLSARNAREAIDLLRTQHPGLIVSDIGLPDEDGCSLLQRVRRLPRNQGGTTPAIALTAFTGAEQKARALAAGFDVFMSKPLEVDRLIRAMSALVVSNDSLTRKR